MRGAALAGGVGEGAAGGGDGGGEAGGLGGRGLVRGCGEGDRGGRTAQAGWPEKFWERAPRAKRGRRVVDFIVREVSGVV